jgi:hypothetical protein
MFAILTASGFLLYIAAYGYCLVNDRDALRSETYSIQKLAIEKGYIGDSTVGILRKDRALQESGESSE